MANKRLLRERSPLVYVLIALIPYSKPNMLLSFKPRMFYQELEKISKYKQSTLKKAYYRGVKSGLIEQLDKPRLSKSGQRKIVPFTASTLGNRASLMVIFDVPETRAAARRSFRTLLRQWGFRQVQKSVWISGYDLRSELIDIIDELNLRDCVEVHESVRLYPPA
ncbi:MAG: hypothetical protein WD877_01100 [Candidatus Saccharimonadales bacterium]